SCEMALLGSPKMSGSSLMTTCTFAFASMEGLMKSPQPVMKKQAVKRHYHKHNIKHRYEFLETLGKGTYGKVKKAIERSGRVVAIKCIRKDKIKDEQDLLHIRREIEIMSSLSHPHIITIYEVFENKDKIVIVMEYASKGDLYDYINERQKLTEPEARHFFRQIVSAVCYCHKNGIVHRDLKLENILLDANGNIKIADFGLSNLYCQDQYLQTFCGSPLYASPEIVNGRPYKGPEVDSWSLGVLLYILVHGAMPFDGQDYKNLVNQISNGEYRQPTKPSADACGLIRWMLMVNPERRATIEDIASHWWVNWGYKVAISELESTSNSEFPLAAIAEWLQRCSRPLFENGSKVRCFFKQTIPGVTLERQRSLKKSKKENDISQTLQEGASVESPCKSILKRPKGILKKRNSQPKKEESSDAPVLTAPVNHSSTDIRPATPPKKGILKKTQQRESGYYSSPEHSEPFNGLDCKNVDFDSNPPLVIKGVATLGRKGILKRNGKFSHSGKDAVDHSTAKTFGSLDELSFKETLVVASRNRTVSEDSILSTESFDQLDLPKRESDSVGMRSCVSADSLLHLDDPGNRPRLWNMKCYQDRFMDSNFSLTDYDNVTEVYKRPVEIGIKLS
uniref:non-specific serine/threonine protein kinase n=1 Tax=Latimeria chalumnae TaxID=7897 RepID=H3AL34_LATCH